MINDVRMHSPKHRMLAVIDGGLNVKASVGTRPSALKPKLLDQVRQAIRTRHYSEKTEKAYVHWIKRFIFFHNKRHPVEMAELEIGQFLLSLATDGHVSAWTQNQAFNALLFLYHEVLNKRIGLIDGVVRAKRPHRLPVVLTKDEVKNVIDQMIGAPRLMAILLYGAGLRLMECCCLRIKDIDFSRNEIVVRAGKGDKDRHTMLPSVVRNLCSNISETSNYNTTRILRTGWVGCPCPRLSTESIRTPGKSGDGNGRSRRPVITAIP